MVRRALAILALIGAVGSARAEAIKVPLSVIEAGWRQAKCSVELKDEERDGESLGGGFLIVEVYCWRAAYQAGSIFFAVDPKAPHKARLLKFPTWEGRRLASDFSITSAEYEPKGRTMGSFHKGRGIGDCGSMAFWKWNGKDFTLTKQWRKSNCDGNPFDDSRRWQVYPPRR